MARQFYKRNIYAYALIGRRGDRLLSFDYLLKVIEYAAETAYPLNRSGTAFSEERIPIITRVLDLGSVRDRKSVGIVYGYLRHEGLSAVYNRATRQQEPLSRRLASNEDLYEYAHMLLFEPGIILAEVTSFTPRHGVLSRLLTGAGTEFCNNLGEAQASLPGCDEVTITLRPLYRKDIQELIKNYIDAPIRSIRVKIRLSHGARLQRRTTSRALFEWFSRRLGIDLNSRFSGAATLDTVIGVGRSRNASLDLTVNELISIVSEARQALGEDALKKFTIRFGNGGGAVDLVEDLLAFKEVPIARATIGGRNQRSTDTRAALSVIKELANKNFDDIVDSYNHYLDHLRRSFRFKSISR